MNYRPEYRLDRLRIMIRSSCPSRQREQEEPLRWLRTMVFDLTHTAERDVNDRLSLQQRSAVGCAVERVVCKVLSPEHLLQLLPFVTQCVAPLTSLDLRGCTIAENVYDSFLPAVAEAHSMSLQHLYLPLFCCVTQSTLERFTQLEELDVTGCKNLTNVDFCSATLRVLYANKCFSLTDSGLRNATRLEVLHVGQCTKVTNVSPFAHCLLDLDVSNDCGIRSAALSNCRRLQVLTASYNRKIATLQPFAQRLRELNAVGKCALRDAALAGATGLVSLSASFNTSITTVAPFGASLRRLAASYSMIGDEGLVTATKLVYLFARMCSFVPFSASLLELNISWDLESSVEDQLCGPTKLLWLNVSGNPHIRRLSLEICRSLRHLVASSANCALTNGGLCTATQLMTLNCTGNSNLTTIEPFQHSLEELTTHSTAMFGSLAHAVRLRRVETDAALLDAVVTAQLEQHGFVKKHDSWIRDVS